MLTLCRHCVDTVDSLCMLSLCVDTVCMVTQYVDTFDSLPDDFSQDTLETLESMIIHQGEATNQTTRYFIQKVK